MLVSKEQMNPWSPVTDPLYLKVLGKVLEELGECSSAVSRCVIQGIEESEPTTGKPNREWLEDEVADVMATLGLMIEYLSLDADFMKVRSLQKAERLATWFQMPVKE